MKTFTTSNLVSDLKYKHKSEYDEYQEGKSKSIQEGMTTTVSQSGAKQLTLAESCNKVCLWDINDHQAHNIYGRIGELIATYCQPLPIFDDQGFLSLVKALEPTCRYSLPSRCYITDNVLP